ncbi:MULTISPECIES: hypothetical protein [unclassified Thiocapsa]|uniref:hypothetical protein n=1 Tax=unclassified Thiocapsa TaxID=2641286 RepID=UPI0035B1D8DE
MKLMHWLSEHDWETWDEEIEKDSAAGKLDFLINEALEKKQQECLVKFNAQNHRAILGLLLCLARTSAETRAKEL